MPPTFTHRSDMFSCHNQNDANNLIPCHLGYSSDEQFLYSGFPASTTQPACLDFPYLRQIPQFSTLWASGFFPTNGAVYCAGELSSTFCVHVNQYRRLRLEVSPFNKTVTGYVKPPLHGIPRRNNSISTPSRHDDQSLCTELIVIVIGDYRRYMLLI